MALGLTFFGSIAGFLTSLFSLIVFNVSWTVAFSLYIGIATIPAFAVILLWHVSRSLSDEQTDHNSARA